MNTTPPLQEMIKQLPTTSGVYLFFNLTNTVIYVGKAVNLKSRVQSYFRENNSLNSAKRAMVQDIHHLEIRPCDSEIEALILESQLIKKYNPRYNVLLKDDKSYAYLAWTKEPFPRIFVTHKTYIDTHPKLNHLGPFVNGDALRKTLRILRKTFHYRSCKTLPSHPCIYYKLGLCDAPCIGAISEDEYHHTVQKIIDVMKGKTKKIIISLEQEMQRASEKEEFETALEIRNQIESLQKVSLHKGVIETQKSKKSSYVTELQTLLNLDKAPKRIEGFDSSHFHGDNAVVSMVVFENGKANKSEYRRFRIKNPPEGGDDFYNLRQALTRRFAKTDWPIPDLILIDGGKGQLNTVLEVQSQAPLIYKFIPIISLAKQLEEIYIPKNDQPIRLPKHSKALQLLQQIRDESHRFAITYHRNLREKLP